MNKREAEKKLIENIKSIGLKRWLCVYEKGWYHYQLTLENGEIRYWSTKNDIEFEKQLGLEVQDE